MPGACVLELANLRFAWPRSQGDCLNIAALRIAAGERVFLHGPSGCGKSSLLSLMAGVLLPQEGHASLLGQSWRDMRVAARDRYRVDHVGYIFQQFNLLPYLSVMDNVLAPCRFSALRRMAAARQSGSITCDAQTWLDAMGLERALWSRPARDLSVGQQQRVAAARALIGRPAVVIADEPTSALDEDRRAAFLQWLLSACDEAGSTLVFVSHDRRIAEHFPRQILLPSINEAAAAEAAPA
ncbi:ABC transporter ATP-binding protein [Verminephrobacter eiseniae]|uniref:ABC transporter ATP-binding protein n=1 Tax=Verminephrobacter eiseniae TaxID=364317 RepID=UPI0010E29858|nr:ABC transporter ATP-binding protein [Verminephrobacter eiseniae]KAB7627410.1 ABC transporter ATP-binding protein [Verminephrobacter sp. Larva24]MCW5231258.1 ABC transporter ATP-binding protein [Verminephrobacter eiseniae]MCW5292990.1 ABC transporter ATP-binding protein [Verminephrobacter eiseniae]MCW8184383.1 ABC transporter ATP-binding protein [Verminephrobacter eiseniae]MCW8221493.1 ABC transporter ATP-binding protein [Verminephrobacter eiseniae]